MRAFRRAVAVAALAPLLALGVPAVASAATPSPTAPGCEGGTDEYGDPLPCELELTVISPICDNDVPKLQYAVDPVGTPNTTVTISFLKDGVPTVVYPDQPLNGTVLWPGAVEEDGVGVDWPGWSLVDGEWVEGDEYDWVRPTVTVQFEVNPTATVDVAYPPSTPQCATSPSGSDVLAAGPTSTSRSDVLAATGSQALPLAAGGAALLAAGAAALLVARRRRQDA